jgi:hypothetical protein
MRFSSLLLVVLLLPGAAIAQVGFQPPGCEFRAVFVSEPKLQEVTAPLANGNLVKSYIATFQGIVDGQPNIFRAECAMVQVPVQIDETLVMEDLKTTTQGSSMKNVNVWIEKDVKPRIDLSNIVGRARGELLYGSTTIVMDLHRYYSLSASNMFDAWVGSPKDVFPTRGNKIFLLELSLSGKPIN